MSRDLFDIICDLDDRADELQALGYVDEADRLRALSDELKGCIVLTIAPEGGHD